MGDILSFPVPLVSVPSEDEFDMIKDGIIVGAELLGDEGPAFVAQAKALSPDRLADLATSLASSATWLRAWGDIVHTARQRLIAAEAA